MPRPSQENLEVFNISGSRCSVFCSVLACCRHIVLAFNRCLATLFITSRTVASVNAQLKIVQSPVATTP